MGKSRSNRALRPAAEKVRDKGGPSTARWALAVSVFSLVVSGSTLYFNYVKPFAPLVTLGGPVFQLGLAASENTATTTNGGPEFDPIPRRILAIIFRCAPVGAGTSFIRSGRAIIMTDSREGCGRR